MSFLTRNVNVFVIAVIRLLISRFNIEAIHNSNHFLLLRFIKVFNKNE